MTFRNRGRRVGVLLFVLVSVFAMGCGGRSIVSPYATNPNKVASNRSETGSDRATLVVSRRDSRVGAAHVFSVRIGGREVARLKRGSYVSVEIPTTPVQVEVVSTTNARIGGQARVAASADSERHLAIELRRSWIGPSMRLVEKPGGIGQSALRSLRRIAARRITTRPREIAGSQPAPAQAPRPMPPIQSTVSDQLEATPASPPAADQRQAKLVIHRRNASLGASHAFSVLVDGKLRVELRRGTYASVEIPVGSVSVEVISTKDRRTSARTEIQARADGEYHLAIELSRTFSAPRMRLVSMAIGDGRTAVRSLRRLGRRRFASASRDTSASAGQSTSTSNRPGASASTPPSPSVQPRPSNSTPSVIATNRVDTNLVDRASSTKSSSPPRKAPATPTASQQLSPWYATRTAVVIGINRYQNWPDLEGAVGDARRVGAELRAAGFDRVIEIYDEDATRSKILSTLGSELMRTTDSESLVVVFFAGHGQTETLREGRRRGYIIPVDSDATDLFATAIPMDVLSDVSARLPAKHIYFAMDSCYSGLGFVRGISIPPKVSGYIDKITSRRAVQLITAGAEGEQAIELGGQGVFTSHFVRAIRGEADFNGDGHVTASEIGAFVKPRVTSESDGRQTPQFGTLSGSGEVVFTRSAAQPRKTAESTR